MCRIDHIVLLDLERFPLCFARSSLIVSGEKIICEILSQNGKRKSGEHVWEAFGFGVGFDRLREHSRAAYAIDYAAASDRDSASR